MKVLLAGYNVDTDVLEDLKKNGHKRSDVTPETLSASYARISRDPRPIDELRKLARQEVEKSRKSNSTIIFKMGHHSIAEHAVFNFDIIGVSRLAFEEIEKFRLCAYTEKSQRYQKLEDDFVVPEEIKKAGFEKEFSAIIKKQNEFYHEMVADEIEPEDARYITSLATQGQVGQTINARNLEFLFRRFSSHSLAEIRDLGKKMFSLVKEIAPSIILFTEANDFDQKTYKELQTQTSNLKLQSKGSVKEVSLDGYTPDPDNVVIAALIHTSSQLTFKECLEQAKNMKEDEKKEVIKTCFKFAEFYDRPQREFEYVDLTYNVIISAAGFGQLKRHRMASITAQAYDPKLGITIPKAIKEKGYEDKFKQVADETSQLFSKIAEKDPVAAQYVLTNAHRKRVLIKLNARELYHVSRLREDKHAQWDIREISEQMTALAKQVMPLTMLFIGGKDHYTDIYQKQFGKKPKVVPMY